MISEMEIPEPTLRDVIEHMDGRFDTVDVRLTGVEERLTGLEHRLGGMEVTMADIQDDLRGGLRAIDLNSTQLLDYGQRIVRLEKGK